MLAATLSGCGNSGPQDGPSWRLTERHDGTPIPTAPVRGTVGSPSPAPVSSGEPEPIPVLRTTPTDAAVSPSSRGAAPREVIVQPGDTLTSIAQRHRVSVSAIMYTNKLADARLTPGQRLLMPVW